MKKIFGLVSLPLILLLSGCGAGDENLPWSGSVTTIAGTAGASGVSDGAGTLAKFNFPSALTAYGVNLYVADSGSNTIRKLDLSASSIPVTTLVGTAAGLLNPTGIATDGIKLYVADTGNHVIRQVVISSGVITTLAGTVGIFGSTDSPALFKSPSGITTDGTKLYVADSGNNTIRQIVIATGAVTTLAGTAGMFGSTDNPAKFNNPSGITTDGVSLYVADTANQSIRRVDIAVSGVPVTTIAGNALYPPGATDGTGLTARFNYPAGIAREGSYLYVADTANHNIRKIGLVTGEVTTLAGATPAPTVVPASGVADGTSAAAKFNFPKGITSDGSALYVADTANHTIRKIQ